LRVWCVCVCVHEASQKRVCWDRFLAAVAGTDSCTRLVYFVLGAKTLPS
jgi:hypothetical protein